MFVPVLYLTGDPSRMFSVATPYYMLQQTPKDTPGKVIDG